MLNGCQPTVSSKVHNQWAVWLAKILKAGPSPATVKLQRFVDSSRGDPWSGGSPEDFIMFAPVYRRHNILARSHSGQILSLDCHIEPTIIQQYGNLSQCQVLVFANANIPEQYSQWLPDWHEFNQLNLTFKNSLPSMNSMHISTINS